MTATAPPKVYVHTVMYRNGVLGTLCDSLAWGPPTEATAVTADVTCPACRGKLEGARERSSVSHATPGPFVVVISVRTAEELERVLAVVQP